MLNIPRAQGGYHISILAPKYILYSYMDPLGLPSVDLSWNFQRQDAQGLGFSECACVWGAVSASDPLTATCATSALMT